MSNRRRAIACLDKAEMSSWINFCKKKTRWCMEFAVLYNMILACGLEKTIKRAVPCSVLNGKNVILVHRFMLNAGRSEAAVNSTKSASASRQVNSISNLKRFYPCKMISNNMGRKQWNGVFRKGSCLELPHRSLLRSWVVRSKKCRSCRRLLVP